MGDRIVFVLPDDASDDDRDAAAALGAHEILTRTQLHELVSESAHKERSGETSSDFVSRLTPAEKRILGELAYRPDTRSRLATRLGVTTSTLDNQLAALKRKLLAHLVTLGSAPDDGYLSTEALIGWASRHMKE